MTELPAGMVRCPVCGRVAADDNLSACDVDGCIGKGIGWHYVGGELTCSVCLKIISHEENDMRRGSDLFRRL